MKKYGNSSYWLDGWDADDSLTVLSAVERNSRDLYRLSASKRAISNFVNIVSGEQIPVKFNTKGSHTDGKSVIIGSNVSEPKDFDVAVGLALHEGSHIKLSDFKLLRDIDQLVSNELKELAIKRGVLSPISVIKDIWNIVEDRRIDYFVFTQAPGYRDYYRAMYDKFFNDKLIDKALLSDEYTEENIESYLVRICNIHNKNTRLNALKGLPEIFKTIDLANIGRLKNSKDTFDVAVKVFEIILNNIPVVPTSDDSNSSDSDAGGSGDGSADGNGSTRKMTDDEFEDLLDDLMSDSDGIDGDSDGENDGDSTSDAPSMKSGGKNGKKSKDSSDGDGSEGGDGDGESSDGDETEELVELTDRQKEILKKKIQKQADFLRGNVKKRTITKSESNEIETIDESGSDLKTVGADIPGNYYANNIGGVNCVVVKRLTRSLLNSNSFPLSRVDWEGNAQAIFEKEVSEGIRIGTLVGKKLQIRGENRETVFNRQQHGKIDKRLISSLGFGNENVFQYTEVDAYKKANLHISIDASSSMRGSKWKQTLTNVVALCKAADMISNINVQVTFRTTVGDHGRECRPYIVMAYDSRVDKFSKVKQMFGALGPSGTTPEGLCFEAIANSFLGSNNDIDSYFLNISDGEPYFHSKSYYYGGDSAYKHTRKMVKLLEAKSISVLSYFVSDHKHDTPSDKFREMYGRSAKAIDVTNVNQIVRTMNELFLQK